MQSEVHDPNHFLYFDGLPDSEKTEVFPGCETERSSPRR